MIKKFFNPGNNSARVSISLLILRVAAGAMMLTHGYPKFQKLLTGNLNFGNPLGIGSELSFILVVFGEFVCSILLILGLFSRFASIPLAFAMFVAFAIRHADDPFGTQEKPLLYFVVFIVLLIAGPGNYSMDKKLFGK
jgi:putative oxidoreductase